MNDEKIILNKDIDRMKNLVNKINNNEINIYDLSIIDMIELCDYIKNQNSLIDKKIYLKKLNLELSLKQLEKSQINNN